MRAEAHSDALREPGLSGADRLIVFVHDGIWRVTWENGCDVLTTRVELDAWREAKRVAEREGSEALLFTRHGDVRLRADFRVDRSETLDDPGLSGPVREYPSVDERPS